MAADHLNPDVSNTAARYLNKAMTRVNPRQRPELLQELIRQAEEYLERVSARERREEQTGTSH